VRLGKPFVLRLSLEDEDVTLGAHQHVRHEVRRTAPGAKRAAPVRR
jgi:hypothetical protein